MVALAVLLIAGCTSPDGQEHDITDRRIAEIKDQLRAKGPAEKEMSQLEPLMIDMAEAIVALVPDITWRQLPTGLRLPCEAVPGDPDSASSWSLPDVVFDGPIPDSAWPAALASTRSVAERVGADELVVRVDKPGHHDIRLIGADKVQFGLISREASVLSGQTGCHLNLSEQGSAGA
nr:LppA family lipoprotein [Rhodococcus sp. (in: high G+C Gram-positive bacteria)]